MGLLKGGAAKEAERSDALREKVRVTMAMAVGRGQAVPSGAPRSDSGSRVFWFEIEIANSTTFAFYPLSHYPGDTGSGIVTVIIGDRIIMDNSNSKLQIQIRNCKYSTIKATNLFKFRNIHCYSRIH